MDWAQVAGKPPIFPPAPHTELILAEKDKRHADAIQANNAQTEVLSANARMIESHTAAQTELRQQHAALTAEVRELAAEIRRRPARPGEQ